MLYFAIGNSSTWTFIGTAKTKPRISVRRAIKDIPNDLAGDKPADELYAGQDALIVADVNRMSLAAYYAMAACPRPATTVPSASTAGSDLPGDIGTLLGTEAQYIQLAVVFPYSTKAAYTNAGNGAMPPGYTFYSTTLESPDDIDPGTQDLTIHMVWHAFRTFSSATYAGIATGTWLLYTPTIPVGLPAPT